MEEFNAKEADSQPPWYFLGGRGLHVALQVTLGTEVKVCCLKSYVVETGMFGRYENLTVELFQGIPYRHKWAHVLSNS